MSSPESLPRAVRRRGREEITQQIVAAARRHLAVEGAPGLSLRAVARELGMVSSAVYRYVAGRDELLTLLIIDAYDALGAAVEDAEGRVPRADLAGRWAAACHGVRGWALAHPHEYALLYGSPVPGYAAPVTTIGPATRVTMVLSRLIGDAVPAVPGASAAGRDPLDAPWRAALAPVRRFVPPEVPDEVLVGGLMAWTYLFGAVSFELFGHRHDVIAEEESLRRAFFEEETARIGALAGLPTGGPASAVAAPAAGPTDQAAAAEPATT